jgi:chitinase domain-containing protein 1
MKWEVVLIIIIFCVSINLQYSVATLSKKDKKKKTSNQSVSSKLPTTTVIERGLVSEAVKSSDILKNYKLYSTSHTNSRQFNSSTISLGYVTPWNNHGYDTAKWFTNKFTHISPVWLQVRPSGSSYSLTGTHDIDQNWVNELRRSDRNTRIVPRVLFEGWSMDDYQKLFTSEKKRTNLAAFLSGQLIQYRFDGAVFEIWSQLGGRFKSELAEVVKAISHELHRNEMHLILVIPSTKEGAAVFSSSDFNKLLDHVDGFSLMTYDYSSLQTYVSWLSVVICTCYLHYLH